MTFSNRLANLSAIALVALPALLPAQGRNEVFFLRGPYNFDFRARMLPQYRFSAAIHVAHGLAHDWQHYAPRLEDAAKREAYDTEFDRRMVATIHHPPMVEPQQQLYAPNTAVICWDVLRAIDWTHMHHEQTYDIMASRAVAWPEKSKWTERSVDYYLAKELAGIPRSVAPLDITMRRAGVMMKPYFTLFRNGYPKSNGLFWVAHWWHPVIYEAQMLGGNGPAQVETVSATDALTESVLRDRPERMLLSREAMPRYSRMSPRSANIFDNLHMLHGITYDIMTYKGYSEREKSAELRRVIRAMSYQSGDERYARKFPEPYADMDPRVYYPWMKSASEGEMPRIMGEMMEEMMPMMAPDATDEEKRTIMDQFKKKMAPGRQEGEFPGSLMDALKAVYPKMKMMPDAMKAGATPEMMVNAMLAGWEAKHGTMPDIAPYDMSVEPQAAPPLPPIPAGAIVSPMSMGRGGAR